MNPNIPFTMMREHTPLPTLARLGLTEFDESSVDAHKVATEWFSAFTIALQANNVPAVIDLLIEKSVWRDLLALTWDLRTFQDTSRIKVFLDDCLATSDISGFNLKPETILLTRPFPDIVWIQAGFEFQTKAGVASGLFRIVPTVDGKWRGQSIFTNLEGLKSFPEKIGALRSHEPNHGKWESQRRAEQAFEDSEPSVLIIGGGQSGLELGARLKVLGVSHLIVEKNPRIGDNWRNRYSALCLHDPVWNDHMPYLPFPSTWPVYTPALKFASWLESYAEALELNTWTSSSVTSARKDANGQWIVEISRGPEQQPRIMRPKHLVFATGLSGRPNIPAMPGADTFKGQILHSVGHKKALDHAGKKVVVVGACTSAHDICKDYAEHGIDVTMFQRSSTYVISIESCTNVVLGLFSENGPPVDVADRLSHSIPHLLTKEYMDRVTGFVAQLDKELLDGLNKRGFRTNLVGLGPETWNKASGYYLDTGASQYIIDGKIKLKNDAQLASFTPTGLKFDDGSELEADVVVFATGFEQPRVFVGRMIGEELGSQLTDLWGLDEEGEMKGAYKHTGVDNLWWMCGHIGLARFFSKHVALQIKAMEEGVFGNRYSKK